MHKRNAILLLGIFSIIILIAAQIIIIKGVWRQKDEMLNLRYRLFCQDAIELLARQWSTDGFDTARMIIGSKSEMVLKMMAEKKTDTLSAEERKDLFDYVSLALNKEEDLSAFLSRYFELRGIDKDFTSRIVINRF